MCISFGRQYFLQVEDPNYFQYIHISPRKQHFLHFEDAEYFKHILYFEDPNYFTAET